MDEGIGRAEGLVRPDWVVVWSCSALAVFDFLMSFLPSRLRRNSLSLGEESPRDLVRTRCFPRNSMPSIFVFFEILDGENESTSDSLHRTR